MKVTIIKSANVNAKPQSYCTSIVDDGLLNKR